MNYNESLIVIPSRYASTRLPGKPLLKIAGKEMVRRVYENAMLVADKLKDVSVVVATDDERMVLANTLFYLKQNTSTTSSVDQSFYDEAAPEAPEVKVESLDSIHLVSKDLGTEYEYKVEAVPGITDQPSYQTNICKATAESGLKGFITGVSASEEPMKDLLVYGEDGSLKSEVTKAQDGKAVIDISKCEPGVKYLHVYAVDNAGNVSKETVTKVKIPNIVTIDSMKTVADTYVLEADENQDLTFTTDIGYTV